jgi:2-dehydropantoate 2-reductase
LGSVFGGFLRIAGHEVTLLGRAAHVEAISRAGLHLEGIWGEHQAAGFAVVSDATALGGVFDAILITVKSYHTDAVVRAVGPRLAAGGVCIPLQKRLGQR